MSGKPSRMAAAWRQHERRWKDNRYVYAVVSRRSGGVSIGINLNPDKGCNFNCIYCQVNRNTSSPVRRVDLQKLAEELDLILQSESDGSLYTEPPFSALFVAERGIRDIAFSGDGEPTTFPRFEDAVRIAALATQRFALESAKLVLLTNAVYLTNPDVRAALAVLGENKGEIWAKLDAGTEEYFRLVNRPNVTLQTVLGNILDAARVRPVVIQSLWHRINGIVPTVEEIRSYCDRLNSLMASGGLLKTIQLHTIARNPAEAFVSALSDDELDRIASLVSTRVPAPVEVCYGTRDVSGLEN